MKGQGSIATRKNLWCLHHGKKTQNNHKLSATVERDPKNRKTITSTRKREDTRMMGKNCLWRCFVVPFDQSLNREDNGHNLVKQWILRFGKTRGTALPTDIHSHELAHNALIYSGHMK